jgi:hypothetical protein
MFPEDAGDLVSGAETLLAAADRDVGNAVATQNVHDMAADSLQRWLAQKIQELGLTPPGEAQ